MQLAASARTVSATVESLCQETDRRVHDYLRHSKFEITSPQKRVAPRERPVLSVCPATVAEATSVVKDQGVEVMDLTDGGPISLEANEVLCEFLRTTKELTTLRVRGIFDVKGQAEYSGKLFEATVAAFDDKIAEKEDALAEVLAEVCKTAGVPPSAEFTIANYSATLQYLAKVRLDRINNFLMALAQNTSITELDLGGNAIGTAPNAAMYCSMIAAILDENTTMLRLDLSDNSLGMANAGIVTKGLTKNVRLVWVNLSGNMLLKEGADAAPAAEDGGDEAVFGPMQQGLEAISEVLRKNKFLTQLILRNNDIVAEGVTAPLGEGAGVDTPLYKFIEPLKKYHRITTLDLTSNALGDGGTALLCDTLRLSKSITSLNLSNNDIGFEGLRALASLLSANVVQRLALRKNIKLGAVDSNQAPTTSAVKKIGKKRMATSLECVRAFCLSLTSNTSLVELDLNTCKLGSQLVREIAEALAGRAGLMERLDVSGCNAGAGGEDIAVPILLILLAKTRQLDFAWNFLDLQSIVTVFSAEETSMECRALGLSRCGINHDLTVVHAMDFRLPLGVLTSLDLSHNTERAVQRNLLNALLSQGPCADPTLALTALNVSNSMWTDESLIALMQSPWALNTCRSLDVGGTLFTDAVVDAVISTLQNSTTFETLRMGGTVLTLGATMTVLKGAVEGSGFPFAAQFRNFELWSSHMPQVSHLDILTAALESLSYNLNVTSLEMNITLVGNTPDVAEALAKVRDRLMNNATTRL